MITQQVIESHSKEKVGTACPSVLRVAGTSPSKTKGAKTISRGRGASPFGYHKVETPDENKKTKTKKISAFFPTKVFPDMISGEVKRRTGFDGPLNMIAYIAIICNGDFSWIRERRSSLTWFEEWFLYFEWKFGQTARRQVDLEKAWGIHNPRINAIKEHKAAIKEQQ